MITYELAKQLKDAGFKFSKFPLGRTFVRDGQGDDIIVPTLSELIQACGLHYEWDNEDYYFILKYKYDEWEAGFWWFEISKYREYGDTPEEAVAKLYLELNKKHEICDECGIEHIYKGEINGYNVWNLNCECKPCGYCEEEKSSKI